jgi:hypothetical protein
MRRTPPPQHIDPDAPNYQPPQQQGTPPQQDAPPSNNPRTQNPNARGAGADAPEITPEEEAALRQLLDDANTLERDAATIQQETLDALQRDLGETSPGAPGGSQYDPTELDMVSNDISEFIGHIRNDWVPAFKTIDEYFATALIDGSQRADMIAKMQTAQAALTRMLHELGPFYQQATQFYGLHQYDEDLANGLKLLAEKREHVNQLLSRLPSGN